MRRAKGGPACKPKPLSRAHGCWYLLWHRCALVQGVEGEAEWGLLDWGGISLGGGGE